MPFYLLIVYTIIVVTDIILNIKSYRINPVMIAVKEIWVITYLTKALVNKHDM